MNGKKKINKKNKRNQVKHGDFVSTPVDKNQSKSDVSVSNRIIADYDHAPTPEMNHHSEPLSSGVSQSFEVPETDFEQERHKLEANFEDLQKEINKIEDEKNLCSQNMGNLEEKVNLLQDKVNFCIQREDGIEDKIKRLEQMNQSIALEESSIKETVADWVGINEGLQMQVMELIESRDSLAQENRHFTEIISALESRIQQLETLVSLYDASKNQGEIKVQQKTAGVLEEQDILTEEFMEKHAKNSVGEETANNSSPSKSATSADSPLELQEKIVEHNEDAQTIAITLNNFSMEGHEDLGSKGQLQQMQLLELDESRISEDVVSIPFDDIIIPELQQPTAEKRIPFSDAPLIGAPFRLISFVTRYVSGADLVD